MALFALPHIKWLYFHHFIKFKLFNYWTNILNTYFWSHNIPTEKWQEIVEKGLVGFDGGPYDQQGVNCPQNNKKNTKISFLNIRFSVQETRVGFPTKCLVLTRTHVSNFKHVGQNMEHIIHPTFKISHVACNCFQMLICQNISNCTPYKGALRSRTM